MKRNIEAMKLSNFERDLVYTIGIPRTKSPMARRIEFVSGENPITRHGRWFHDNGYKNPMDYFTANPDGLDRKAYSVYITNGDGTYQLFYIGTPSLGNSQNTALNDNLTHNSYDPGNSKDIKDMSEKMFESQNESTKQQLDTIRDNFKELMAGKDQQIEMLRMQIENLQVNSGGNVKEWSEMLQQAREEINSWADKYDEVVSSMTTQIIEAERRTNEAEKKFETAQAEFKAMQEQKIFEKTLHEEFEQEAEETLKGLEEANASKGNLISAIAKPFLENEQVLGSLANAAAKLVEKLSNLGQGQQPPQPMYPPNMSMMNNQMPVQNPMPNSMMNGGTPGVAMPNVVNPNVANPVVEDMSVPVYNPPVMPGVATTGEAQAGTNYNGQPEQ